jgi:hypothetical protein
MALPAISHSIFHPNTQLDFGGQISTLPLSVQILITPASAPLMDTWPGLGHPTHHYFLVSIGPKIAAWFYRPI